MDHMRDNRDNTNLNPTEEFRSQQLSQVHDIHMTALYKVTYTDPDGCYGERSRIILAENQTQALEKFSILAKQTGIEYLGAPRVQQTFVETHQTLPGGAFGPRRRTTAERLIWMSQDTRPGVCGCSYGAGCVGGDEEQPANNTSDTESGPA